MPHWRDAHCYTRTGCTHCWDRQNSVFAERQVLSRFAFLIVTLSLAVIEATFSVGSSHAADAQRYVLLNLAATEVHDNSFQTIQHMGRGWKPGQPRLGVAAIISYLRDPPAETRERLQTLLGLCKKYELPVVVQLDGEQWWQNRPDLWNWWDKSKPGYDPANAANVEW